MPLSVDEKEVAFVPNSDPDVAINALPAPHVDEALAVLCGRVHSLIPFTLQMVIPFLSPVTVHPKLKVLPGQVGGAAVNCVDASPAGEHHRFELYKINQDLRTSVTTQVLGMA